MITITHESTIDCPVDKVFAFMADAENDPRWCPPVLEVKRTSGNGVEVGTRYQIVAKPGPFKAEGTFEIVDYQPNRRIEYKGRHNVANFHYWYTFEPNNGATQVRMTSSLALKGWLRLLQPIIRRASEQVAVEEFQNLKRILEEGG